MITLLPCSDVVAADTYDRRLATRHGLAEDLARDVFLLLWQGAPRLRTEAEIPAGRRGDRVLLEGLLTLPECAQLRLLTVHDATAAAWAAQHLLTCLDAEGVSVRTGLRQRLGQASAELSATREGCAGWGLDQGKLARLPYAERSRLAERINARSLAEVLHKVRDSGVAGLMPTSRRVEGREEMWDVDLSGRLHDVLPSQYARLTSKALRLDFYRQVAEESLLTSHYRAVSAKPGPLVICVDVSASMQDVTDGHSRDAWAKAALLLLLTQARQSGRPVKVVLFATRHDQLVYTFDGSEPVEQVVDAVESSFGGGTNFAAALSTGLDLASAYEPGKADIVFVSDGECSLTDVQMRDLLHRKASSGVRIHGLAVGSVDGGNSWRFADSLTQLATASK